MVLAFVDGVIIKKADGFPYPLHIAIRQIIEHNRKLWLLSVPKTNFYHSAQAEEDAFASVLEMIKQRGGSILPSKELC
jgi:hypothetical protein